MEDDILRNRVVYTIPGMENARIERDLIYRKVNGISLKMDIYIPPGLSNEMRVPGVVFIHGGPLSADLNISLKDIGQYLSYGELLAATGFVAVTFNHRFHDINSLERSEADVTSAISYIRKNAETFSLDPDRLCLWFISGGGPLLSRFLSDRPRYVRCMVAYYPILDPQVFIEMGMGSIPEETFHKFSPVSFLASDDSPLAPMLIVRAGLDHPKLNQSIDRFLNKALSANVWVELINYPQGPHAFDILVDNPQSRQIIARTLQFLKTTHKQG